MENVFIEFLPPWVETNTQPAFYDKESGSVLQQTARMYAKVNELTASQNELLDKFAELYSFTHDYFDNLDVQEEINNKLDDMADAGTLQEIITAYLTVKGVLAFNTVADMKASVNLVDGSFAKTYGKTTLNDKKGAFYKIREILNTDVVDEDKIVSLTTSNTLIAEKIDEVTFDDLNGLNTTLTTSITNLTSRVTTDEISTFKNFKGKVCYFGDSYSDPDTCPTNWLEELNTLLGLTNDDILFSSRYPGSGFIGGGGAPTWGSKILECVSNTTQEQRNEVSAIIIGGGFNDRGANDTTLYNAMNDFNTVAKANFPNAQIYLAMIGWTVDCTTSDAGIDGGFLYRLQNVLPMYSKCGQFGWKFLENCQYVMHDFSYYLPDNVHPNADGSKAIASAMYSAINGSCGVHKPWLNLTANSFVAPFNNRGGSATALKLDNNLITCWLCQATNGAYFVTSSSQTFSKNTFYPFINIINGYGVADRYRPIYKSIDLYYEDLNNNRNKVSFKALIGFNNGQFGFVPLEDITSDVINMPPTAITFDAMQF